MCDLAPYSQDFEGLDQQSPSALADDGWLIFANVFGPDWSYWYGYGVFPAPNGGPGFSGIDIGQGGPDQGMQQLVIYNDYNNGNHGDGSNAIIEANVFQEQLIGAADVGNAYRFEFDAKRGNIELASIANAFIKTLDPNAGFQTTNFITADMTNIDDNWDSYSLSIFIDPSLEGQLLQIGFVSWASRFEGSGIFYDNINFDQQPLAVNLDIKPGGCPNPMNSRSRGDLPVALLGTADFDVNSIDVASLQLEGVAPLRFDFEDVATPFDGDLCGCTENGRDGFMDLTLKFDTQDLLDAIGPSMGGSRILTVTGNLLDGTPIEGQDCVIMVGGGGASGLQSEASVGSAGGMDFQMNADVQTDTSMTPTDTGEARTREGKGTRRTVRPLRDRME
jgi:hypothetical protein